MRKCTVFTLGVAALLTWSQMAHAGLVAYWAGDGNAQDSAGTVDGAWYGTPSYASGHNGQAFDFSGSANYVELGTPTSLQFTSSFSISAWFKASSTVGQKMVLNYEDGYEVAINDGRLQYALYGVSQPWSWVDTGIAVTAGQWFGFLISYDAGSHEVKTYDGTGALISTLAGPTQLAAASSVYPATSLRIGARHGSSPAPSNADSFFSGQIDEVRLYDQVIAGMPASTTEQAPEPATLGLLLAGLGLGAARRFGRR